MKGENIMPFDFKKEYKEFYLPKKASSSFCEKILSNPVLDTLVW